MRLFLLLSKDKPVIVAHLNAVDTNYRIIPIDCLIEINNRCVPKRWHWMMMGTCYNHLQLITSIQQIKSPARHMMKLQIPEYPADNHLMMCEAQKW